MEKCKICEIKNIRRILFHGFEFQKCIECSYIRIYKNNFDNLIHTMMHDFNIGNMKKNYDIFFCNEYELKIIDDFKKILIDFEINKNIEDEHCCDVCLMNLYRVDFKNNFYLYFCNKCKSIYFLQTEFDKFLSFLPNELKRHNYFLYLKVILKNKIRKIFFKLKEIFLQRRKKNNAKK